ncbi:hypothetical protein P8452_17425 [Trifolium repens]|nr:hypothetical protein P8452_17425 [Trifolium repens]
MIKKDSLYHDALTARTVQAACTRFNDLVGRGRTVALRSNAEVADLLLAAPAADGHAPAADGDTDTFALGQLCEEFIDPASTRLARSSVRPAVRYYLYEDLGPDQRSTQENFIFLLVVK